jgi:hypothetical protein
MVAFELRALHPKPRSHHLQCLKKFGGRRGLSSGPNVVFAERIHEVDRSSSRRGWNAPTPRDVSIDEPAFLRTER